MGMSIEVRNLSKQFGTFAALRDISLEVHSGELLHCSVLPALAKPRCYE
jgi:ABC-type multidrug transport system ATPase subunit